MWLSRNVRRWFLSRPSCRLLSMAQHNEQNELTRGLNRTCRSLWVQWTEQHVWQGNRRMFGKLKPNLSLKCFIDNNSIIELSRQHWRKALRNMCWRLLRTSRWVLRGVSVSWNQQKLCSRLLRFQIKCRLLLQRRLHGTTLWSMLERFLRLSSEQKRVLWKLWLQCRRNCVGWVWWVDWAVQLQARSHRKTLWQMWTASSSSG